MTTQYGERKEVYRKGNLSIDRLTAGFAYPRNGNVHNPTPRFCWIVMQDGKPMGSYETLRAAKVLLKDCQEAGG
jgi:hypothetical protein